MKFAFSLLSLFAVAGSATATVSVGTGQFELDGTPVAGSYTERNPSGVSYSVYTGLTNPANQLFQVDASTAGGDVRVFGAAPSSINPYIAVAGGVTRTVSDSAVSNGLGGFDLRITVTGSGNLFPSGFTGGGQPLSGAGVGLGLNLGARGNGQLVFANNIVTQAFVSLLRADGSGQQFGLSQSFFPNSSSNLPWNGAVGVAIAGIAVAANDANPFVAVQWDIRTIPTPGAVAFLGMGVLVGTRRRRA
jgi:hypothetical protein